MSEEIVTEAPVLEQEITATPEPEIIAPEDQPIEQPSKTFTQEELDAAIGKRLAKEQRKWEREQAARFAEKQPMVAPEQLSFDQFESPEAYAEALALKKAEEIVAQREYEKQRSHVVETYAERAEEARSKYDDFDQIVENPRIKVSTVMAETIYSSEIGPEIAYFLGSNPKEAERIFNLQPLAQAREIGKLEVKLNDNPPVKKTSSAPAPIVPISSSRSSGTPSYDTTDPRSVKTMSTSEWIEAERKRQIKKLEAQRHR